METLSGNSVNCTHATRLDSVRQQRARGGEIEVLDRGKMREDQRVYTCVCQRERERERERGGGEGGGESSGTMLHNFNSSARSR